MSSSPTPSPLSTADCGPENVTVLPSKQFTLDRALVQAYSAIIYRCSELKNYCLLLDKSLWLLIMHIQRLLVFGALFCLLLYCSRNKRHCSSYEYVSLYIVDDPIFVRHSSCRSRLAAACVKQQNSLESI